jgi:hypothetical protein
MSGKEIRALSVLLFERFTPTGQTLPSLERCLVSKMAWPSQIDSLPKPSLIPESSKAADKVSIASEGICGRGA